MSTPITYSIDAGKTTYHSSIAAKVFEMGQMKASNVNSFQLVVLIEACFHGDMQLVEKQLGFKMSTYELNCQSHGVTALMAAIKGEHDEVLKRLITAGASVNCRNGYGDVCSGNPRFTALSFAVKHHRESAVRLMLPHIDENALDSVDEHVNDKTPGSIIALLAQCRIEMNAIEAKEELMSEWANNIRQVNKFMDTRRREKWLVVRDKIRVYVRRVKKLRAQEEKAIAKGTYAPGGAAHKRDKAAWKHMWHEAAGATPKKRARKA